jgi:hypothetical protein
LSLESQRVEPRSFAAEPGVQIAQELVMSASAKEPGRPVFSGLMKQVRAGKVNPSDGAF